MILGVVASETGIAQTFNTSDMGLSLWSCYREKDKPKQKSHFLPGAIRKNRRFCLISDKLVDECITGVVT